MTALKGMFGRRRRVVSIEVINAAIAKRGAAAGCEKTITFDGAAAKGAGMTLIS